MPRTIDQQIAEAENRVQRLKAKKRTKDTHRKILVGAVALNMARKNRDFARIVLKLLERDLTREVDIRDAAPLIEELRDFIKDGTYGQ